MRISFVTALILFLFSNVAYANCQLKLDESKGEARLGLRGGSMVPLNVKGKEQERYGAMLVAYFAYHSSEELEAINPRYYIYNPKACEILKTVQLYPSDEYFHAGDNLYMISFNQPQGLIYITSMAIGTYENETRHYYYTEIYSFDDLSMIRRIEDETPLVHAEFVDDGKMLMQVERSREQQGYRANAFYADSLALKSHSEFIGKERFNKLGMDMRPNGTDVVVMHMEEQWFQEKGHDIEFHDQHAINLRGQDSQGNYQSVTFTLDGQPLLAVWREEGKTVVGYPTDYEKKFNVKIEPLKFTDVEPKEKSQSAQNKFKKKPVSSEPQPKVETYTPAPSIRDQIAINQAKATAQKRQRLLYIGLTVIVVVVIAFVAYRRPRKK